MMMMMGIRFRTDRKCGSGVGICFHVSLVSVIVPGSFRGAYVYIGVVFKGSVFAK